MRKMVIRIDDVGFSDVCNIGSFKAVEEGVATAVDVMLDCPGTVDALKRLRDLPYVSVGWHAHMWGSPVLPPEQVPSLIEHEGKYKGRFKEDLGGEDIVYEEILAELRAQIDRCIAILGRVPDTCSEISLNNTLGRAASQVKYEYGMVYGYGKRIEAEKKNDPLALSRHHKNDVPRKRRKLISKYPDAPIYVMDPFLAYQDIMTDSVTELELNYDPVKYYTEDRAGILKYPEDIIIQQAWHPGYVDYFVYKDGERFRRERARFFISGRVQDVEALCSKELHDWIKENQIELVNLNDAIFGTNTYQNHLRHIGSDLYMGGREKLPDEFFKEDE